MSNQISNKVNKALKLLAMVKNPTGNSHQDEVSNRIFNEYITKYNISLELLCDMQPITQQFIFDEPTLAELFIMILTKHAEIKNLLDKVTVKMLNSRLECIYEGPKNFLEIMIPIVNKYQRKYVITRYSVQKRIENENNIAKGYINLFNNQGINFAFNNIIRQEVKYSEFAFYNAFVYKYDLIANCVMDAIKERPLEKMVNSDEANNIQNIARMFNKESIDSQLEV